ncbi:hypothetical protein [Arthrobacter monumenti]
MRFLAILLAAVGASWLVTFTGEAIWEEDFPTGLVGGAAAGLAAVVALRILDRWDDNRLKEDRNRRNEG